jgi:hypothetical protein
MDEQNSLPDIQSVVRVAQAKRRAATRKIHEGQQYQRHGVELEREGMRELQEVEAFERMLKSVPKNEQEMLAFESIGSEAAHAQMSWRANVERHERIESQYRSQRDQVVRFASQFLSKVAAAATEDLLEAMVQNGIKLTSSNPAQRVSQILSQDDRFKSQRGVGWSLAGETSSEPDAVDAKMVARARELTRDDENGALRRR